MPSRTRCTSRRTWGARSSASWSREPGLRQVLPPRIDAPASRCRRRADVIAAETDRAERHEPRAFRGSAHPPAQRRTTRRTQDVLPMLQVDDSGSRARCRRAGLAGLQERDGGRTHPAHERARDRTRPVRQCRRLASVCRTFAAAGERPHRLSAPSLLRSPPVPALLAHVRETAVLRVAHQTRPGCWSHDQNHDLRSRGHAADRLGPLRCRPCGPDGMTCSASAGQRAPSSRRRRARTL